MPAQSSATPLSPAEREEFHQLFEKRLEKVQAKTADVFAFRKVSQPPFTTNSAIYWVFGLDPDTLPDAYFDDPAVMTAFQERTIDGGSLAFDRPGPKSWRHEESTGTRIHRQKLYGRPTARRFFYSRPILPFPARDGCLIALDGAGLWLLMAPVEAVHEATDMVAVIVHPKLLLDQFGNAGGRP